MFAQIISISLMASTAMASGAFSPVHPFGAMLPRDALNKRQGYYPTTSYCGPGDTCAESCGPTYETCPSREDLYCFDPTIGEQCCPDLSGNSCDEGYYCTNDPEGITYCCPNDLDLSDCAASYSLTVSLIRQTATPTGAYPSEATSTLIHVSSTPDVYPTASYSTPVVPTGKGNASYTGPSPPEFTGAAGSGKVVGAGVALLAGAAGVAGLL